MTDKQAKSAESKLQIMLRGLFGGGSVEDRDASLRRTQPTMRVANREVLMLLVRSGAESATVQERLALVSKALEADASSLNEECLGVILEVLKVTLQNLREAEGEIVHTRHEEHDSTADATESSSRTEWLSCALKVAIRIAHVSNIALKTVLFELLNEEAGSALSNERLADNRPVEDERWLSRVRALAQFSNCWSNVSELPANFAALVVALQRGIEHDSAAQNEYLRFLRDTLQRSYIAFDDMELCSAIIQTCAVLQATRSAECVESCFAVLEACVCGDRGHVCVGRRSIPVQSNVKNTTTTTTTTAASTSAAAAAGCSCVVPRGGNRVPLGALDDLVRLLVQFANTDRFGRRACSLARRLLTADDPTALRCVMVMCAVLYDAEASVMHGNYAILRGTISCLSAAFWGRESVNSLRHLRTFVLPAFAFAIGSFDAHELDVNDTEAASARYGGWIQVANELILALNRIGRAELLELSADEWRVLFDLCEHLITTLRFTDTHADAIAKYDRDSLSVLLEIHRLLRTANSLFAELRFVGDAARLYELLERVAACIAERNVKLGDEQRAAINDSVCSVLQYRLSAECQMGTASWLSNLRTLMRQHALDGSSYAAPSGRQKQNEVLARYRASLQLVGYLSQACTNVQFVLFADELLTEAMPFLTRLLEHIRAALKSTVDADWAAHADAGWPLLEIVRAIGNYCCATLDRLAQLALAGVASTAEVDPAKLLDRRASQLTSILEQLAGALYNRLAASVDKDATLFGEAIEAELTTRVAHALESLCLRLTELSRSVLDCAPTSSCARQLFELITLLLRSHLASLIQFACIRKLVVLDNVDAVAVDEFADALDAYVTDAIRHTSQLPTIFQLPRVSPAVGYADLAELYRQLEAKLEKCRSILLSFLLELRSNCAAQRVGDARVLANSHKLDYDLVEKLFAVVLEVECSVTVLEKLLSEMPNILADREKHSSEFVNALCKWVEKWLFNKDKEGYQQKRFCHDPEQTRLLRELSGKLQSALLETVLALIGHSAVLHVAQHASILHCLVDSLASAGAGCRPLIVLALIVSLYQTPRSILVKHLPRAVIEMSKLLSSPQLAVPILEFLSHLRQQRFYQSFSQRQLMAVFAMCVPYTAPSYHHFVVTFAHRSIVQWFVTCPIEQRRRLVSYLLSSVELNVKTGAAALDAARVNFHQVLYETCADLIARFCAEPRARDAPNFASELVSNSSTAERRLFLAGHSETWLIGNSLYTVTTPSAAGQSVVGSTADLPRRGSQMLSRSEVQADSRSSVKRRHRSAIEPSIAPSTQAASSSSPTRASRVGSSDDLGAVGQTIDAAQCCDTLLRSAANTRCAELLIRRACGTTRCTLSFSDESEPILGQAPLARARSLASDAHEKRQTEEQPASFEEELNDEHLHQQDAATPSITPAEVILRLFDPRTLSENALLLPRDDATNRALKNLDRILPFESHRIGVIYVAPGKNIDERSILSNSCGSRRYREFLERLGDFVRLSDVPPEYAGGLDTTSKESDGPYTIVWNDTTVRVLFHVATLMPTRQSDPQCNAKKQHIGNDYVLIVYDDSGVSSSFSSASKAGGSAKYRIGTIAGQFGYANIVIEPLGGAMNAVTMQVKPELEDALGGVAVAHRRCVHISDQNVAAFVRQVAVQADLAALVFQKARSPNDPFASNFVERARQIGRIRTKLIEKRAEAAAQANDGNARSNNPAYLDFTSVLHQYTTD